MGITSQRLDVTFFSICSYPEEGYHHETKVESTVFQFYCYSEGSRDWELLP
jgi:hypothetical protein